MKQDTHIVFLPHTNTAYSNQGNVLITVTAVLYTYFNHNIVNTSFPVHITFHLTSYHVCIIENATQQWPPPKQENQRKEKQTQVVDHAHLRT